MTIAELASEATIRKRVFASNAIGEHEIDRMAREISVLRVASYEGRLQQLADSMGLDAEPSLRDTQALKRITTASRDSAISILNTHNDDLRAFLAAQPRGATQAELSTAVKTWKRDRAVWKSAQIVRTEGMAGRDDADRDVITKNSFRVQKRLTPGRGCTAFCTEQIARGWQDEADWNITLPIHPNCVHGWEYKQSFKSLAGARDRVWVGDWVEREERQVA